MKTKFLLPLLAAIFAVGMSFTTASLEDPVNDYVHLGGDSWQRIDEQNCSGGVDNCRVQFGVNGPIYNVYDEENLSSLKENGPKDPIIINPPF